MCRLYNDIHFWAIFIEQKHNCCESLCREERALSEQIEYSLLERARDGNDTAFAELQSALESQVRRFVRRLIGRSDVEDDIVQNTFFALYRNLERIDVGEKLRPFVFRVVRNQCYDELRRQGRYEVVSIDEPAEDSDYYAITVADTQPQPDETTHWLMLYGEVQKAIAQLPEMQRQTLLLYTEGNLSYAEIAEAMNVSVGTIKSRLFYAKRNLAQLLTPETQQALGIGEEAHEL